MHSDSRLWMGVAGVRCQLIKVNIVYKTAIKKVRSRSVECTHCGLLRGQIVHIDLFLRHPLGAITVDRLVRDQS